MLNSTLPRFPLNAIGSTGGLLPGLRQEQPPSLPSRESAHGYPSEQRTLFSLHV